MPNFKCKMCGAELTVNDNSTVCECDYCGSKQTIPSLDDEKKVKLYERANKLRFNCEFDKAYSAYEQIVNEYPNEAEAYWGLLLSEYGIEYVDDPSTGSKVPTCHRSSFDSIMDTTDFEMVMENSDAEARAIYRQEAKQIEELRKQIVEVSGKEEPYDIFICYKETSPDGERTLDSVLAQDIYDQLTNKGYRVFFSRISLEDKLGTEYEPYIFAALNSAKIMLAIGTSYDNYNAVWAKNEWSRFLKLMAKDKTKVLIPCFKDIDAYDIPKEFSKFQALDMSKIGFMQDLIHGIDKILSTNTVQNSSASIANNNDEVNNLLERIVIFLEDGDWEKADEYCEKVLDKQPKNALAYLYKMLAFTGYSKLEDLEDLHELVDNNFEKAIKLADEELRNKISSIVNSRFTEEINNCKTKKDVNDVIELLNELVFYKDSIELIEQCNKRIDEILNERALNREINKDALSKKRKLVQSLPKLVCANSFHTLLMNTNGEIEVINYRLDKKLDFSEWNGIVAISCGYEHYLGLKSDGTVVSAGYNGNNTFDNIGICEVENWGNVVSIIAQEHSHSFGIMADGTVVGKGNNRYGQRNVMFWRDIVDLAVGDYHTVGLRKDGTVVATGNNKDGQCNIQDWKDIIQVAVGYNHTVGLRKDGTVVASGYNQNNQCDVSNWKDIVQICATSGATYGLNLNGTVMSTNSKYPEIDEWENIVSIYVDENDYCVFGLKEDGTVVSVGENDHHQRNVGDWNDIVQISTTGYETFGVKSDGTVVGTGRIGHINRTLTGLKLFNDINRVNEEISEKRLNRLMNKKHSLETELNNLHGLFSKRRREEVEEELSKLNMFISELN